jgi:hypothetical protein
VILVNLCTPQALLELQTGALVGSVAVTLQLPMATVEPHALLLLAGDEVVVGASVVVGDDGVAVVGMEVGVFVVEAGAVEVVGELQPTRIRAAAARNSEALISTLPAAWWGWRHTIRLGTENPGTAKPVDSQRPTAQASPGRIGCSAKTRAKGPCHPFVTRGLRLRGTFTPIHAAVR